MPGFVRATHLSVGSPPQIRMTEMKKFHYGKVKTNRVTLKKYLEIFSKNKAEGESFEAPRPKPGRMLSEYFALMKLNEGSKNHTFFRQQRSC